MPKFKPKIDRPIEVVKVQRPLFAGGSILTEMKDGTLTAVPDVLIYDERRRHLVKALRGDLPKWLAAALEASPKLFARAVWNGDAWEFVGVKQAAWQSW